MKLGEKTSAFKSKKWFLKPAVLAGFIFACFAVFAPQAFAVTNISAPVNSVVNSTWTKSASPYVISGNVYYRYGSLTIEPGTVIKFASATSTLTVHADVVLNIKGTSAEPVYFTSIKDDTVGGDTNGDGNATSPAPGDWGYVSLGSGAINVNMNIDYIKVRYGGGSVFYNSGVSPELVLYFNWYSNYQNRSYYVKNIEVSKSKTGLYIYTGGNHRVYISDSSFYNNQEYGMYKEPDALYAIPGYVIAQNNWWGDVSGPYHPVLNPTGTTTAKLSSNLNNFSPWLVEPLSWTQDGCTENCNSNVLFLPGLEASRLYRPDYSGGTNQLWEPNANSDAEDLFLTEEGKSIRNDVYTKDVIDEAYGFANIYKSFVEQMDGLKTAGIIADWESAPYDWRLSLDDILNYGSQTSDGRLYYSGGLTATSSPFIIQELKRLAATSKTGKATIVAHSNGGLVAKALMQKLEAQGLTDLVDKIIFVAVPQAGTPQAIGALLHGYDVGLPTDTLSVFLSESIARTLALNMPSAYNLLPSADYFSDTQTPVVTFDDSDFLAEFRSRYGSTIQSEAQLQNFITDTWRLASSSPSDLVYPSVGNATLFSRAETVHNTLDNWTPPVGVSLYQIAGWGEETLATIEYYKGKKAYCSDLLNVRTCSIVPTIMYSPKEVVEGDGTVLVPSALWDTASTTKKYWVNLRDYDTVFNYEREHADIFEVSELRTLIQNVLTNSTSTTPLAFITTTQPPTDAVADKHLRFVLHSPLNLSATDNLGNTVNSATSTIPDSRFKRYGEVQVLTVPKNIPLTLNLNAYATGSFTLDIQEIDGINTVTASSTLSAIPSATSTTATMAFTDGTIQNASPLLLDYDGNGTTDFSLQSKIGEDVVFDITPPEATITFDPALQQLKIIGTDNISATTISTTATSSLITDEAGNTLEIVFKRNKQEGKELKIEVQELRYNGVLTTEIPKTVLQYEWSVDKTGKLKELEEKAIMGPLTVSGHYDAKKDMTRIEEKTKGAEGKGEKESKKILLGLVVISLTTTDGKIGMSY